MYYYDILPLLLILALILLFLIAWIGTIYCCVHIAKQKGTTVSPVLLWLIGLVMPLSYFILPLVVIALPDRGAGAPAAAPGAPASPASPASSDGLGLPSL